jgi:N-acetylmuramoyl-L-alanine amidase
LVLWPRIVNAAVINRAWMTRSGALTKLHFGLQGQGLRWKLSAHGNQLWIDLAHTRLDLPPRPFYGHENSPVVLVRAIDEGGGRARLEIEISGRTDYAVGVLPDELLVRLAPAGEVANIGAPVLVRRERRVEHTAQAPATASVAAVGASARAGYDSGLKLSALHPPAPSGRTDGVRSAGAIVGEAAPARRKRFLVVVDPGHGGFDPGTEVAAPLLEKNLALQIAMRLKHQLEMRGVRVLMTRTGDYFVSLHDRTAFANRVGADLFISIHLNSDPDPAVSGIETFYLDNSNDRATIRLARMENASGAVGAGALTKTNLNYILTDMLQQYKANESFALASMIEAQTAKDLDASLGLHVDALGAKRGPFYVLVGARMPAVLIECGFLSNPAEAARLASARYQEVLAAAIAQAAVHYLKTHDAAGNL